MKDPQAAKSPGSQKRMVGDAERPHREHDFHAWVLDQARVLRAHRPAFVDWAGIAEELEAKGASERREIKNRLIVLTAHLLKWKYASTQRLEHERSWRKTIREQRRALSDLLADNRSLKTLPRTLISNTNLYRDHIRPDAMDDTGLDVFPAECPWRVDLILASNFWPER